MADVNINIIAHDMASSVMESIKSSLGGLDVAAVTMATGIGTAIAGAMIDAFGATVKYNDAVMQMQDATGGTMESSSKMLGFMDKLGISQGEANTTAKKLASEGLTLDINTLEALAAKYQAIQDPAAKQKFLLDDLGKSGFQYADMLSMSKTKMDDLYNSIPAALELTQQNSEATKEYNREMVTLNQNFLGLKLNLMEGVIPQLSSMLEWTNKNFDSAKNWAEIIVGTLVPALGLMWLTAASKEAVKTSGYSNSGYTNEGVRLSRSALGGAPAVTDMSEARNGGGMNVQVVYAPTVSTASHTEIEQNLVPIVTDTVNRVLKNNGVLVKQ